MPHIWHLHAIALNNNEGGGWGGGGGRGGEEQSALMLVQCNGANSPQYVHPILTTASAKKKLLEALF